MMTGVVNAYREALISLRVQGPEGQAQEIAAILDTGFNGSLTLPAALVATLRLPFRGRGRAILADGSESLFDIHEGTVIWEGQPRRISVHTADTDPLAGLGLFYGCVVTIQVIEGGSVNINKLS